MVYTLPPCTGRGNTTCSGIIGRAIDSRSGWSQRVEPKSMDHSVTKNVSYSNFSQFARSKTRVLWYRHYTHRPCSTANCEVVNMLSYDILWPCVYSSSNATVSQTPEVSKLTPHTCINGIFTPAMVPPYFARLVIRGITITRVDYGWLMFIVDIL
jgi:hypothetical protein